MMNGGQISPQLLAMLQQMSGQQQQQPTQHFQPPTGGPMSSYIGLSPGAGAGMHPMTTPSSGGPIQQPSAWGGQLGTGGGNGGGQQQSQYQLDPRFVKAMQQLASQSSSQQLDPSQNPESTMPSGTPGWAQTIAGWFGAGNNAPPAGGET